MKQAVAVKIVTICIGLSVVAVVGWLLYKQMNPPPPAPPQQTIIPTVDRGLSEEDMAAQRQKITELEVQIAQAPERDISLILQLGNLHYGIGELAVAVENYDDILSTNPNDAPALENKGQAQLEMGDYIGALESWQKALAVSPFEVTYLRVANLIDEHFEGEEENVRLVLENGITNLGQTPGLLKRLGQWYESQGMYAEAISHYKVALQLDPDDAWLKDQIEILKRKESEQK